MSSSSKVVSSVTAGAKKEHSCQFLLRATDRWSHHTKIESGDRPVLDICSNSTTSSSRLFSGRACAVTSPDSCQGFTARAEFSSSSIFFDICNRIGSYKQTIMSMALWLVSWVFWQYKLSNVHDYPHQLIVKVGSKVKVIILTVYLFLPFLKWWFCFRYFALTFSS